ncbi:hypothetical protein IL38_24275 [Actinopolyspora erythraea]|uniref:TraD/TraG TraM recognition site domain-containing protein n=1 Tax=Actinopolyspora erythraea TaxID=414996 RepID=A0ABR4WY39_9ACTN|nr:TraM recognition domain-containing protein [Actinopolyspora erythraea]KGI79309.1 hypothetical protein IL38_24275 [Actinopolyspora erythraea]
MSSEKDVKHTELKYGAGGLATGSGTYLLGQLPAEFDPTVLASGYTAGGLLLGGAIAHNRWYFSRYQRFLRELGTDGWVDGADMKEASGPRALRAQAAQTRPGLSGRQPLNAYGTRVGKLVSGPKHLRGRRIYSPWSRGMCVLGPQGSGKTAWLIHPVLESPGPTVVASTKPELATLTAPLRKHVGPVHIFNPQQLGTVGNTFSWDPVSGCHRQATADARAWALVRGGGAGESLQGSEFWMQKAQEIIRCYLMAAAIRGWDMDAVMYWANNPDDPTPVSVLEQHPQFVPPGWLGTLRTHLSASHNTRTGYFAQVTSCVGFMDNPTVAAACRPKPGEDFDVQSFLESRSTLYLVGGAEDRRVAPLLTALTEHVFTETKRLASISRAERVDPPLNLLMDEVANITPVPLDQWASDSRGWGITVGAVVQSLSQLSTTWGRDRAETIWENLPTKIVLPGVTNSDDLEMLSYLSGMREVESTSEGESTSKGSGWKSFSTNRSRQRERVVSGSTISGMPKFHAYVLGLGRHPAIVKFEPGQKRAKRQLRRLGKKQAKTAPNLRWQPNAETGGKTA